MAVQKKILCVDDDPDDRLFFTEAISVNDPEASVVEAGNGQEAIDYLNSARSKGESLPCLIVLDINMPFLDGKQTFQRIHDDPRFSKIPVVVLTNSANPQDKQHFGTYGVELYTKPDNIDFLYRMAGSFLTFCS